MVANRADRLCEYCLIAETDAFLGCAVDHIIGEKHGGPTEAHNLALACVFCNRAKGSDIGSMVEPGGEFVRFFNPRIDGWMDHFCLSGNQIEATTAIGRVTARILGFNSQERLLERAELIEAGRYPSPRAWRELTDNLVHSSAVMHSAAPPDPPSQWSQPIPRSEATEADVNRPAP